ncbi:MAG: hypothetical protein ACPL7D_08970 [Candidatus Sumerlaeaceae bacterium]|jgi:hypothetical protein
MTTSHDHELSPAEQRAISRAHFFFIHGDDVAKIENFKESVVSIHLRPDEREENYNEYGSLGSQVSLRSVLGDVIAELSTVSLLPGTKRVVVLYSPQEFYEGRSRTAQKKRRSTEMEVATSPSHILARFIERELNSLPAVLIIVAPDDYEKGRRVAKIDPVYALAQKMAAVRVFNEVGPQFAFFDALFARNAEQALRLWRDWLERVGSSPRPYYSLVSQLRLLIQAKMLTMRLYERRGLNREVFESTMLPPDSDYNILKLPYDWQRQKLMRASANFSLTELTTAYEKLETLAKYAVPLASDPSVPDRNLLSEVWILEFCTREEAP